MAEAIPTKEYNREFDSLENRYALLVDLLNNSDSGWKRSEGRELFRSFRGMGDEKSLKEPVEVIWQTTDGCYSFSLRSGYHDDGISRADAYPPHQVVATLYDNNSNKEVFKIINPIESELIGTIRALGAGARMEK
jgi:hypothetical protein